MSIEIERKFLVTDERWKAGVRSCRHIEQFYLTKDGRSSVRVRIEDGARARLTIKAAISGPARAEFEYEIPVLDAEAMKPLAEGSVIDKIRHVVPFSGHDWEIDVFRGAQHGLVIAEVELDAVDSMPAMPPWVGAEVTHDARYYNANLARERVVGT